MFVTKMCFFLSLRENDIWQFNLATKALSSFRFCFNGIFEALAEKLAFLLMQKAQCQ